jgi:hypothetical protein
VKQILGREPAVFWAMVAAVLQALSLFLPLSETQQGLVNAVVVAAAGFATAAMVAVDQALPALTGLIKAVFALLLGIGLQVDPHLQVAVMALVTALGAFLVRPNVTPRLTPQLVDLRT